MCRWIAYRGEPIALSQYVTEPAHSLISQSIHALESTTATSGDGFGLGWYDFDPEPGLYRDVRPAWSDENLRSICRHIRARLFFAHVRAATGTAVTRPNCHPFACRKWLFMHNGFVGGWSELRRRIEMLIPDEYYPARVGTTDSEALFLAILGAGGMQDPVTATARVMSQIGAMVQNSGKALRFTAALSNGEDLYAFRFAVNETANSLYFREEPNKILIVSEPIDKDRARWVTVPENQVLVARRDGGAQIRPFLP
jgi:glutamine amidotransferase